MWKKLALLALIVWGQFEVTGQQRTLISEDGKRASAGQSTETMTVLRTDAGEPRILYAGQADPSSVSTANGYIVKFREDPPAMVAYRQTNGKTSGAAAAKTSGTRFSAFRQDLDNIAQKYQSRSTNSTGPGIQIRKEYAKAFYGALIEADPSLIADISRLPYVEYVRKNTRVKADLAESVGLIGAPEVWSAYETQGEGITIGIIDTGIDYNHPDLGGGYGEDFKVKGGYDFVNEDDDPMDDNFHGTHVAGIAAADGPTLTGVAPRADLYALKVLDNNGYGFEEDIIEAVEWSMDPNGDGDFSDHLDVVNMSLGGPGDDQTPGAIAVNNAVAVGIVFCVSAGNDYDYQTIGSPGTAARAITVGSTTKLDRLSSFSSKGPVVGSWAIKPDVMAPGSSINSAIPNGEFQYLNGTSMASPHIAGVAALLLSTKPDLTPDQVKSTIVNTAKHVGDDVMAYGNGRVDGLKVMANETFVAPSSLSFGRDQITQDTWEASQDLSVTNTSAITQTYELTLPTSVTGVSMSSTVETFTLGAGETRDLSIALTVDNALVERPVDQSLSVTGFVELEGTQDTLRLPWAFAVTAELLIVQEDYAEGFNDLFDVSNGEVFFTYNPPAQREFRIYLPEGTYDIETYTKGWYDISLFDEVEVSGRTTIYLDELPKRSVRLGAEDRNGTSLKEVYPFAPRGVSNTTYLTIDKPNTSRSRSIYYGSLLDSLVFSDFNSGYELMLAQSLVDTREDVSEIYLIDLGSLVEVSGDLNLTKTAADLASVNLHSEFPDTINYELISFFGINTLRNNNEVFTGSAFGTHFNGVGDFKANFHLTDQTFNSEGTSFGFSPEIVTYMPDGSQRSLQRVHNLARRGDEIGNMSYLDLPPLFPTVAASETIRLNDGLIHPDYTPGFRSNLPNLVAGQFGERRESLYDRYQDVTEAGGQQHYLLEDTVTDNGRDGYIRHDVIFKRDFINRPLGIEYLYLEQNGQIVSQLDLEQDGRIVLGVTDNFSEITGIQGKLLQTDEAEVELNMKLREVFEADNTEPLHVYTAKIAAQDRPVRFGLQLTVETELDSVVLTLDGAVRALRNQTPRIVGERERLSINSGETVALKLENLIVVDRDDIFPFDFELIVEDGAYEGFTIADGAVTLTTLESGAFTIPVQVSDGVNVSEIYEIAAFANNDVPEIIGIDLGWIDKTNPQPVNLKQMLTVEDADHDFPDDFTIEYLHLHDGIGYEIAGEMLVPIPEQIENVTEVYGTVRVNDGYANSNSWFFWLPVREPTAVPEIIGQQYILIDTDSQFVVRPEHLIVVDSDSAFPDDFEVTVLAGSNYEVRGDTITAIRPGSSNTITAEVILTDGTNETPSFALNIRLRDKLVLSQRTYPSIPQEGQYTVDPGVDLWASYYRSIDITELTLEVAPGDNYTVNNGTIEAQTGFEGTLLVPLYLEDEAIRSDTLFFEIAVVAEKDLEITGQRDIFLPTNYWYQINPHTLIVDEDSTERLPRHFFAWAEAGENYELYELDSSYIITDSDFVGDLEVPVYLSDGVNVSPVYQLAIEVIEYPEILNQQADTTLFNFQPFDITFDMLAFNNTTITAEKYQLEVWEGENYRVVGNTIRSQYDFEGELEIPVRVTRSSEDLHVSSNVFIFKANVVYNPPVITGQKQVLSVKAGNAYRIELEDLIINGATEGLPDGFQVVLEDGTYEGFRINNGNVRLTTLETGPFTIPVRITDGVGESEVYPYAAYANNTPPVIVGLDQFWINKNDPQPIHILDHLVVEDPEQTYPEGFHVRVLEEEWNRGPLHIEGNTIVPHPEDLQFYNSIFLTIRVSDGIDESDDYILSAPILEQLGNKPEIIGQDYILIDSDEQFRVRPRHLRVLDADNNFPEGFTVRVLDDPAYDHDEQTITSIHVLNQAQFQVRVVVNDGTQDSDPYELQVNLRDRLILFQSTYPAIPKGGRHVIDLQEEVQVSYYRQQEAGSLVVHMVPGDQYTLDDEGGIVPAEDFVGILTIPLYVENEQQRSDTLFFQLAVVEQRQLRIIGHQDLFIPQGTGYTPQAHHFVLEGVAPDEFTDNYYAIPATGEHYTLFGDYLEPDQDFKGTLTVPIQVSDGLNVSEVYQLPLEVVGEILITGQQDTTIYQQTVFTPTVEMLQFSEENITADKYKIAVFEGSNFHVAEGTLTSPYDFQGTLEVPVTVYREGFNGERVESDLYPLRVKVSYLAPTITGQREIIVTQNTPYELSIDDVQLDRFVTEIADQYYLQAVEGTQYELEGNAIIFPQTLVGAVEVPVRVGDGVGESELFNLVMQVDRLLSTVDPALTAGIRLYPNPVEEVLTIDTQAFGGSIRTMSLIDISGRILKTWTDVSLSGGLYEYDFSGEPAGIYLVKVETEQGELTVKVLKQ